MRRERYQLYKAGDPEVRSIIEQRLEEKIAKEPHTGCWLWTGALNYAGYGVFNLKRRRREQAA